jgi:hypothetical protein
MANVLICIPQYKLMPQEKVIEIAKSLGLKGYEPSGMCLHPKVDIALMNQLELPTHYVRFVRIVGDGQLDRARAWLFAQFLKPMPDGRTWDYMLMLDDDIEWPIFALDRMIQADKQLIGAAYAFKDRHGPKAGKSVCRPFPDQLEPDENGLLEIEYLNGGFMLIRRDAFEIMMEAYPELEFQENITDERARTFAFWQPMIHDNGRYREYLSEDYAFCRRARDAGIKIWLDCKIVLTHWDGDYPFRLEVVQR